MITYVDIGRSDNDVLVIDDHELGVNVHLLGQHLIATSAPVTDTVEGNIIPNDLIRELAQDGLDCTKIPFYQHTTRKIFIKYIFKLLLMAKVRY